MSKLPVSVSIEYNCNLEGEITVAPEELNSGIWTRLVLTLQSLNIEHKINQNVLILSWSDTLEVIRRFGSKETQNKLGFRFQPIGEAVHKLQTFALEIKSVRKYREGWKNLLTDQEIIQKLENSGFSRKLKSFQLRDLSHLLSMSNGANFSVPGSGKTTVTFALHVLTRQSGSNIIVISPKSAFQAWIEVVKDCMYEDAPEYGIEPFTVLKDTAEVIADQLQSSATRFIISYDLARRREQELSKHLMNVNTHLVLDESHHMKGGILNKRGAFLIGIADAPIRRDILTGTPMPQSPTDLGSQLDFLWPGHGFGYELTTDKPPKEVLGNLYVRTTKNELKLPKRKIEFIDVEMDPGQQALYSLVRSNFLKSHPKSLKFRRQNRHFLAACKNIIRLMQLSVNPILAVGSVIKDIGEIESGIIDRIYEEKRSAKMRAVINKVYELADLGKKVVVWTVFRDSIYSLANSLADLNPVQIHGGVKSGSINDRETREGIVDHFHNEQSCKVLIGNPATAGEGISLHAVCHDAIYLDRSYSSTHYLQSIDRIHRLGLPKNQETNVYIYRSIAPPGIGSIDMSVNRSLKTKIRKLDELLNDHDLHEIALEEEKADEPTNFGIEIEDIVDLISELESKKN